MDVTLQDDDGTRFIAKGNKVTRALAIENADGASLAEQEAQTALLTGIEANTNGLLKNDVEVPFVRFNVIQAFTDVTVDDIVVSYVLLNTTTGVGTPYTKRWRGWIDVTIPSPIDDYVVDNGGNPITLAQMQSLGLATEAKQDTLLTELQLKADLTETQPVSVVALPLPTGAATAANQTAEQALIGATNSAAAATDTSTSGLNGLIKRLNQRVTSLIALLPTALSSGFFQVSLKEYIALVLSTGSAIIGKVGIDQTTDGTTNLVVTKNRITTVSSGSGTIAAGNTAQTAIAADAAGYHFRIQNNSSGDLWYSTLAAAIVGQPSERLPADAVFETPNSEVHIGALSVIGATTGQAFTVRKW